MLKFLFNIKNNILKTILYTNYADGILPAKLCLFVLVSL